MTTTVFDFSADAVLKHLAPDIRERAIASRVLLRKAQECQARGKLQQACVYGWGAAEEITKAVAENWKEYGVMCERPQDLRALVNALSVTDPKVIVAIDDWRDEADALDERYRWERLDDLLSAAGWDWQEFLADGFNAAENLLDSFDRNDVRGFIVEHDLKRIARLIDKMQDWLLQPSLPDGFRQFHNQ